MKDSEQEKWLDLADGFFRQGDFQAMRACAREMLEQDGILMTAVDTGWITDERPHPTKLRLAEEGYDPVYGARPLKRVIQRRLQDALAMRLLAGEFNDGDTIRVDVDGNGAFTFSKVVEAVVA